MKKLSILLAGILLAGSTYGAVGITSYESVKQKAMGGATILSEVNENALVNNPALLNEINKFELNIAGMSVSISADTPELVNGLMSMAEDLKDLDENDIITVLTAYLDGNKTAPIDGKIYNEDEFKLSNKKLVLDLTTVIGAFAKKGFGIGVFGALNVNDLRLVNKPASPEITVDIGSTFQVPVGIAFDFGKKDQYVVGTSLKFIGGFNAYSKINAGDLSADNADIPVTMESYGGIALDLGTIYKSSYLNYALTVNNAFSDVSVVTKEGDNPESDAVSESLPLSINIAISNKFDKKDRFNTWWDKYAFWTLELKNITSADINGDGNKDENLYKKIHFGASSSIFNNSWVKLELRGGLNQGYPTFGFGSELLGFFNFDYAYSTRELGFTVGSKPETLHSFTIDFRL